MAVVSPIVISHPRSGSFPRRPTVSARRVPAPMEASEDRAERRIEQPGDSFVEKPSMYRSTKVPGRSPASGGAPPQVIPVERAEEVGVESRARECGIRRSACGTEKSCRSSAATSSTWRPRFRSSSRKTFTRIVFSQRPPAACSFRLPERPVALQQRLLHEVLRFLSFQPARQGESPGSSRCTSSW